MRDRSSAGTAKLLSRLIAGLLVALMFTPLIVTHSTLYPYQVGKGIALRLIIEAAGILYLWLCLVDPRFRPERTRLFWSVLAFAAATLLATMAGVDPYRSWWGDLGRMEGAFGLLHGVAVFVIASGLLRTRASWMPIFRLSLVASVGVLWYALAQLVPWLRIMPVDLVTSSQPGSTFGYASFLATYALIQVFFAAFLVVMERSRAGRWAAIAGLALNLFLLSLTAIRGAQVGLLAAVVVGGVAVLLDRERPGRHRLIVAAALVVSLAGSAALRALDGSEALRTMPRALQRMATISLNDTTARTRLIALGVSGRALLERPLVGWGPENFGVAYGRHFDPAMLSLEDAWFDRPHNKLAEVAVHTGLAGLAAYLAMLAIAAVAVVKRLRSSPDRQERTLVTLVLMFGTAYAVQNLFLFDTSVSTMLFFLSLAFVGSLSGERAPLAKPAPAREVRSAGRVVLGAGVLLTSGAVWSNISTFRTAVEGLNSVKHVEPHRSLQSFRHAMNSGGYGAREVVWTYLQTQITLGRVGDPEWEACTHEAQTVVERWIAAGRSDARLLELQGKVYNRRGMPFADDAVRTLRQSLEKAPRHHEAMYELGLALLRKGDVEGGLDQFRAIVALNDRYPKGHWILGVALVTQKRFEEGLKEVERAVELGYPVDSPAEQAKLKAMYQAANRKQE